MAPDREREVAKIHQNFWLTEPKNENSVNDDKKTISTGSKRKNK